MCVCVCVWVWVCLYVRALVCVCGCVCACVYVLMTRYQIPEKQRMKSETMFEFPALILQGLGSGVCYQGVCRTDEELKVHQIRWTSTRPLKRSDATYFYAFALLNNNIFTDTPID